MKPLQYVGKPGEEVKEQIGGIKPIVKPILKPLEEVTCFKVSIKRLLYIVCLRSPVLR